MSESRLPNMGIEPGMHEPVNIDHLYKDPAGQALDVEVLVTRAGHATIAWTVGRTAQGHDVHRQLHVVREGRRLANWGPYTATAGAEARGARRVLVGRMGIAQRRALEGVARRTEVRVADVDGDGRWEGVCWVREVMEGAVREGLITPARAAQVVAGLDRVGRV